MKNILLWIALAITTILPAIGAEPHEVTPLLAAQDTTSLIAPQPAEGTEPSIISRVEHDSVWKAAHRMCMKRDFDLAVCDPDGSGEITPDAVKDQFERSLDMQDWKPGLVSVMTANNETGVVNDTAAIAHFCHANGLLFHSDAVQAAGILPLDTKNVYPVDFMTISSHKINGPKGMGALFARDPEILSPLIHGGADQEFGYRGGTENVTGCFLRIDMETKNYDHVEEIITALQNEGFKIVEKK